MRSSPEVCLAAAALRARDEPMRAWTPCPAGVGQQVHFGSGRGGCRRSGGTPPTPESPMVAVTLRQLGRDTSSKPDGVQSSCPS